MKRALFSVALCLFLAGCGGDDKTTDPNDSNPTDPGDPSDPSDPIDPAGYQLSGMIYFDGRSISTVTNNEASFWIRDESTGQSVEGSTTAYDRQTGEYGINDVPNGPIGVSVEIQVSGESPTHPGNYRAWKTLDLSLLTKEEAQSYRISMSKIIHMTQPWDNNGLQQFNDYPSHTSPVSFSWEAIPGAVRYDVHIEKYSDQPYGYIETVVSTSQAGTTYNAQLGSSGSDTHYEFDVYAYTGDNEVIGYLMVTYDGGYGWDYRFVVP